MARLFNVAGDKLQSAANPAPLDILGTAITLAVWFSWAGADQSNRRLLFKGPGNAATELQYALRLTNSPNALEFNIGNGTGIQICAGATTLTADGLWHHFAGRLNGTAAAVFLDGVSNGTAAFSIGMTALGGYFCIGNTPLSDRGFFGRLAEAAVWDVSLSDAEIASLAKGIAPALIRPQSLRGYWPLLGNASPEVDLRNGSNLTVTSVDKTDHPRILTPSPAIYS